SMSKNIVGARRLLDPPEIEALQLAHARDRLLHFPLLVGVDHELARRTDLRADRGKATDIVFRRAAYLDFEMPPTLRERLATEFTNVLVGVADPSGGCRVSGASSREQARFASAARLLLPLECLHRFVRRQRIGDVSKVDARDDLFRREVRQQLPERFLFGL